MSSSLIGVRQRAVRLAAEQQGEYDSSRYAPCDAPVTPGRYRGFYEQEEPTTGEGGENESTVARDIQARP